MLTTVELGPLTLGKIPEDFPSLSDHELIILRWEDLDFNPKDQRSGAQIGWDIQGLIENKVQLDLAKTE